MNIELNFSTLVAAILASTLSALIFKIAKAVFIHIRRFSVIFSLKRIDSLSFIDNYNKIHLNDGNYFS